MSHFDGLSVPNTASAHLTWSANGHQIDYTASAGHVSVINQKGELQGKMFYMSYLAHTKDGEQLDSTQRPVSFCFNGGPGSASVPINFGGIGPKRVETNGVAPIAHAAELVDNPHTLLQDSDLVFLDALGTGWSRVYDPAVAPQQSTCTIHSLSNTEANANNSAAQSGVQSGVQSATQPAVLTPSTKPEVFGVKEDAEVFCHAIAQWLEENNRWSSPVYLVGESYGTVRNSVLMRLLGEASIQLTGVVMISALFDWTQTLPGNILYYVGLFPTFAATAHYFKRAGHGTDAHVWFEEASDFAKTRLTSALMQGDNVSSSELHQLSEEVAHYIGLPVDLVERHHARIDLALFRKQLLADTQQTIGRLDTRFSEDDVLDLQSSSIYFAIEDPSYSAVDAQWGRAFRNFVCDVLGYRPTSHYHMSVWSEVGANWNWRYQSSGLEGAVGAPNVAIDIATTLRRNPELKMLILGGRFDAATPWLNVKQTLSQLFMSNTQKRRIDYALYDAGHMMYIDEPTLVAMGNDLHDFYSK